MKRGKQQPLESSLSIRFRTELKQSFPNLFSYKIPDTYALGGKKPFDSFAFIHGKVFVFEFKRGNISVATPYQAHNMMVARLNGAHSFLVNEKNYTAILDAVKAIVNGG